MSFPLFFLINNYLVTFKSVYMVTDFYEKRILSAMDHKLPEACDNPGIK